MELYNEDCFEALKRVKDKSINLFLLDLPYGQTACKWDSLIDLEQMWKEIKRTMVKDGIILFFCTTKFGYKLIQSNEKWFKYDLVWKKSRKVGFLSANKMPLRQHELVYVFKDKAGTYNPQKTKGHKTRIRSHNKNADCDIVYGDGVKITPADTTEERHPTSVVELKYKDDGEIIQTCYGETPIIHTTDSRSNPDAPRHPTSILEYKNPHKSVHKTQKPVELCEWLIKTYSNEGDMVMDFCMGSGTTGVACKNTNRKFIGVEKDEEIFKIAQERINQ